MCHSDERSEEESSTNIHQPVSSELVELVEVVELVKLKLVLILPFSLPPFLPFNICHSEGLVAYR
jgi:hypothetical protein